MDAKYEHFKDFSSNPMSFEEKKKIWLELSDMSEEEFGRMMAHNKERQVRVPQVGTEAPDFEIERLDPARKRSGEYVKLSAQQGKPVALLFGSYT